MMKKNKCNETFNELLLYIENALTDSEKKAVQEHLDSCSDCREELQKLKKLREILKSSQGNYEVDNELPARIIPAIRGSLHRHSSAGIYKVLAGTFAFLLVIALAFMVPRKQTIYSDLSSRDELREEYDRQFHEKTEELECMNEALKITMAKLMEDHEELDRMNSKLKRILAENQITKGRRNILELHLTWKTEHKEFIKKAEGLIESFNERRKLYEEMEASHDRVSLSRLKEDHKVFTADLEDFIGEYNLCQKYLNMAELQVDILQCSLK